MNSLFKVASLILILATVIQAIALAYVLGYEHGVNSQLPIIQQLHQRHVDFFIWLHPMRNTLFGTGIILVICWAFVLFAILQKRLSKPKKS